MRIMFNMNTNPIKISKTTYTTLKIYKTFCFYVNSDEISDHYLFPIQICLYFFNTSTPLVSLYKRILHQCKKNYNNRNEKSKNSHLSTFKLTSICFFHSHLFVFISISNKNFPFNLAFESERVRTKGDRVKYLKIALKKFVLIIIVKGWDIVCLFFNKKH